MFCFGARTCLGGYGGMLTFSEGGGQLASLLGPANGTSQFQALSSGRHRSASQLPEMSRGGRDSNSFTERVRRSRGGPAEHPGNCQLRNQGEQGGDLAAPLRAIIFVGVGAVELVFAQNCNAALGWMVNLARESIFVMFDLEIERVHETYIMI